MPLASSDRNRGRQGEPPSSLALASTNRAAIAVFVDVMMAVAVLPSLVFWIWGIVLAFKYRNRLVQAAVHARQTWAASETPRGRRP